MSGPITPPHLVVAAARRAWSDEEKRVILAEAAATTTSISAVARRHGVHASLLFRWRRAAERSQQPSPPTFVPLALPAPATPSTAAGLIEVDLAGGHRVRAEPGADPALLRTVIAALLSR